jgi:diaminohydroxyphosphoribosylaminopyrimidine deaminase / 5-amino-6-(5-phosphoribosylamino)uracil reductase
LIKISRSLDLLDNDHRFVLQNYFTQSPFEFLIDKSIGSQDASTLSFENKCFQQALLQAYQGVGRTYPNPPVGSVIVKENQIVGKGFTSPAGHAHAEINALQEAGELARGGTLYSTLEPCHHFGRTPPCTQAIILAGIKKVVIGVKDPNPKIEGNGIRCLLEAGIEVILRKNDELNAKAHALILPFAKHIKYQSPWVICKVATSLDGCVTTEKGVRTIVSHQKAKILTHRLRNWVDGVVIGSNTTVIDNPSLTVRHLDPNFVRNPHRIVIDGALQTDVKSSVYDQMHGFAHVVHTELAPKMRVQEFDRAGISRIEVPACCNHVSLPHALKALGQLGMTSVLVECGAYLLTQLIKEQLFDELWWIVSPKIYGNLGVNGISDKIPKELLAQVGWSKPIVLEEDALFRGYRRG